MRTPPGRVVTEVDGRVRITHWIGVLASALTLSALPLAPSGQAAVSPALAAGSCTAVDIPVALSPAGQRSLHLAADYCVPAGRPAAAVDVLVPGATYDDDYWTWPQDPAHYSYAQKTLQAGRAVLAIDRLGTGGSSHPDSTEITAAVSAYAVHQAITWVRGRGFSAVNLIGHSVGSVIATLVDATWPADVTRLVLTGYLNDSTSDMAAAKLDVYPADDDPLFAASGLDAGYLTTKPGTRASLFYGTGASPAVIAGDEAHKDVVSGTEFGSALTLLPMAAGTGNPADQVTAPVLVIVGQDDYILCEGQGAPDCASSAALHAHEMPYFSRAASLTTLSVTATGHDLALSPTADLSFAMINNWLLTH